MSTVRLENAAAHPICVLVEPLGDDYWIAPNQTLHFSVPDRQPTVSWYESGASVWVNEGDPRQVVVTTGEGDVVACGYERPPGAFDGRRQM